MAQKSILSFFTKTVPKKEQEPEKTSESDSDSDNLRREISVNSKSQNKRRRIISSDEETPKKLSPAKKKLSLNTDDTKIEKIVKDEKKNDKQKTPKNAKEGPTKIKNEKKKEIKEESPKSDNSDKIEKLTKVKDIKKENEGCFTKAKDLKLQNAGQGLKGADYNPSKRKYHPIDDAFWNHGEKVPYLALAKTFEIIENTSGRLKSIETLSNLFRSVIVLSPTDLLPCVYLSLNQLAPAYEGMELGIAETTLMKAIAQSTGRSLQQIKSDAQSTGDLGIVAEQSRSNQRMMFTPAPHTVECVFSKLREIASMSGISAMSKKVDKIQAMFVACRHSEARFIIRSLAGKLRIGLAEQSLLQALAQACATTPPNQKMYPPKILDALKKLNENAAKAKIEDAALIIKSTYCQCPNYHQIIPILLEDGIDMLLDKCEMKPGTPLKPMLAHPTNGVNEILKRFEGISFTCEWKYDGERAQIHIDEDGNVSIYSRNQENNTSKYPDIIARIENVKGEKIKSCIIDSEAVAWDNEKKTILPFQILSTRKRKDANETDIKVQVCVYMFDLLYLNKKPLTKLPFIERRKLLHDNFNEIEGQWKFATFVDTTDIDEVQSFLEESVKGNCEGLMVKTLEKEATYEIAKRSRNWLKLKKDYLAGVGDSLDLVVIGGYKGRGKRTGTYGGFLLACYDQANEEYQSICKIGTGFSDEDLQTHTEFLKPHVVNEPKNYYRFDSSHEPDEWFEPVQVWEVKCADLSLSPVHRAAMGIIDPVKGISLRFPRFIRIRDDKSVEDATSAEQVADMYSNQDQIKNQENNTTNNEEDFY